MVVLDLRIKVIPDFLTLPAILYVLIFSLLQGSAQIAAALVGIIAGGGAVLAVAVISRGAIGGGDIKLAALLGGALGWKSVLAVLVLAQIAAAIIAIGLLVVRRAKWREPLPVGAVISFVGMLVLIGSR
jgi:prepilin signal peptidase PulO-like enzyme (type II secretory pathway)